MIQPLALIPTLIVFPRDRGGWLVPLAGQEGWLVIRSLSKLLSFVYTPRHTTGTTQGRVLGGEQLSCNTSFRFGQLSAFLLLGEEVHTNAVI